MHQTQFSVNAAVNEASRKIAERDYPDINDVIESLILHSVGQRILDYRWRIEHGESTVKLALLDHKDSAELLSDAAVDMLHRRIHPNSGCPTTIACGEVMGRLEPVLESTGLTLELGELDLAVKTNAMGHSGKYNIVITTS